MPPNTPNSQILVQDVNNVCVFLYLDFYTSFSNFYSEVLQADIWLKGSTVTFLCEVNWHVIKQKFKQKLDFILGAKLEHAAYS